MSTYTTFIL